MFSSNKLLNIISEKIKRFALFVFLPLLTFVLSCRIGAAAEETNITFSNPIIIDDMAGLTGAIFDYLSTFIVVLALLFTVLGAIFYMLSGGDPAMIKRAKNCWTFSLVGFAIVVAAPTFLLEIVTILGGAEVIEAGPVTGGNTVSTIVENVLDLLLSILGMICIISLTIAGGMYMTSAGDDDRIKTAKKIAQYAVVGLVVALSSLVVLNGIEELIEPAAL